MLGPWLWLRIGGLRKVFSSTGEKSVTLSQGSLKPRSADSSITMRTKPTELWLTAKAVVQD